MVMQRQTQRKQFWLSQFEITDADIDYLYNVLLESEMPLTLDEMALLLVRYRVRLEERRLARRARAAGKVYRPEETYEVGETLIFVHLDRTAADVLDKREGDNPDYGDYEVLHVQFDDGDEAEFVSGLTVPHALNGIEDDPAQDEQEARSAEDLFIEYGGKVAELLEGHLEQHEDLVRLAARWFPRSLMVEINEGHLNLAEAVLFMHEGGPLDTREMLNQIGILSDVTDRLAEFSLNYAMIDDKRFDEVGPAGHVLWFLKALEPAETQEPPELLQHRPPERATQVTIPEMQTMIDQIADELTEADLGSAIPKSVTVTLTYPHWRSGTVPLSAELLRMFPTALQSERIRCTILDKETDDEFPAWVVRHHGYVFGLREYYTEKDMLPGAYMTVHRMDRDGKVTIEVETYKPRVEWVLTASVVNKQSLRFATQKRRVGVNFDDLMIIDMEDPDAIDTLARLMQRQGKTLAELIEDLMEELGPLYPQQNINARTLYAVVNLVRRMPPAPIFGTLEALPQFEHVGGPYWRLSDQL